MKPPIAPLSKELLNEVLGRPIKIIRIDENKCEIRNSISFENYQLGVSYSYLYGNQETRFIPIHELAHKCKEWANKKDYWLVSFIDHECGYCQIGHFGYEDIINSLTAQTEPEAIFKACQWVLENETPNTTNRLFTNCRNASL